MADRNAMVAGLVEALNDKQGELEIELKDLELEMINARIGVKVSGVLTVTIHVREMDEREKKAHVDHQVQRLHA